MSDFSRYRIVHSIYSTAFSASFFSSSCRESNPALLLWEANLHPMLLYALGYQSSVTGFIDFLGIAEPDQIVSGVIVGVLHSVI